MIDTFNHLLLEALSPCDSEEEQIEAAHLALTDPDIDSVGALSERLQMDTKQLSRFSSRFLVFSRNCCSADNVLSVHWVRPS